MSRESWRFTGGELGFAEEKSEARRYVRARNWRGERGLPRYVFVVSPTEPRPFYVDFDAPVYVNILAKAARRLARKDPEAKLTITEMLPSPEHAVADRRPGQHLHLRTPLRRRRPARLRGRGTPDGCPAAPAPGTPSSCPCPGRVRPDTPVGVPRPLSRAGRRRRSGVRRCRCCPGRRSATRARDWQHLRDRELRLRILPRQPTSGLGQDVHIHRSIEIHI